MKGQGPDMLGRCASSPCFAAGRKFRRGDFEFGEVGGGEEGCVIRGLFQAGSCQAVVLEISQMNEVAE